MKNDPSDIKIHNASQIPPEVLAKFIEFARLEVTAATKALVLAGVRWNHVVEFAMTRTFPVTMRHVQEFCEANNLCPGCCGSILAGTVFHSFWKTMSWNMNKSLGLDVLNAELVKVEVPIDLKFDTPKPPSAEDPEAEAKPKKRSGGMPGGTSNKTPGVN